MPQFNDFSDLRSYFRAEDNKRTGEIKPYPINIPTHLVVLLIMSIFFITVIGYTYLNYK